MVRCGCAHTVVHLPHDAGEEKAEQKTHVPPSRELVRLGGETGDRRLAYGKVKQPQKDGGDTKWGRARRHTLYVNISNLKSKRLPNLEKPVSD